MRISDWSSDVCSSDLQAMGALHAVYASERARHADRAALVAADGHLDLAGTDQRAAARRRAAGRIAHLPRIMHRTGGVGMAAARQAEIFAMRLAHDRPARKRVV